MRALGFATLPMACWLWVACGGKTAGPATTGSSSGTAGSSGAGFGDLGNVGDPGPGQSSPGNPTGGSPGMPSPSATVCGQICDRISQAGCTVKDCLNECSAPALTHTACAAELDAALKCFSVAPIACANGGQGAEFFGCDRERDAVTQCLTPPPSTPPTPPVPPPNPTSPGCVGAAPVPPSGMVCSGGGSGTGSTGGGAQPTCEAECSDPSGNVWSSFCVGPNCSCMYNGKTYCSCVSNTSCSSCCPGGI